MSDLYVSWFTPMTMVCESSLAGAEKTIFLAPAFRWGCTFSVVRNTPVDSQTYSAPCSVKGISAGSRVVRQGHLLAIDHQGVPIRLDGAIVAAMDGVVLHLV